MRVAALLLNVALLLFTIMVCMTDGMPTSPWYLTFTWFLLLLPPVSAWALWHLAWRKGLNWRVRNFIAGLNALLVVLLVAAVVDQWPHPDEQGLYTFIALTGLTPLLSGWALLRYRAAPPPSA